MKIQKRWLVLFLLPASAVFAFIYAIPVFMLIITSFTRWVVASKPVWNGFNNYIALFTRDQQFLAALWNTLRWMLLQGTIHVAFGVLVALVLARKKFYWKVTRTVFMLPNIISSAAVGMMFIMLLNPSFGAVTKALEALGLRNIPNWFMNPGTAFGAVTATWLFYAATVTILVLAEMSSLDESMLDAAKIDGANDTQTSIHIILPLMKSIICTTTVLAVTSMLQKLDILMMTSRGGPGNATLNLPMYVYNTAFVANDFGTANTVGVVMIVVGLVAVWAINRIYGINPREG